MQMEEIARIGGSYTNKPLLLLLSTSRLEGHRKKLAHYVGPPFFIGTLVANSFEGDQ